MEIEWGFMIAPTVRDQRLGCAPGAGLGADRLYDWNLEGGVKFVWR